MTSEHSLPTNVGSNEGLGVIVPERDALAYARARISLLGAGEHMDTVNAALDAVDVLHTAIAAAYGYLWCVNNEPGTPRQYPPERAAYEARKLLRHLLTKEQRGQAVNEALTKVHKAARDCGCRAGECESKPTGCRMAEEVKPGSGAQ